MTMEETKEKVTPVSSHQELLAAFHHKLQLHFERKKNHTHAKTTLEKLVCKDVCIQHMGGHTLVPWLVGTLLCTFIVRLCRDGPPTQGQVTSWTLVGAKDLECTLLPSSALPSPNRACRHTQAQGSRDRSCFSEPTGYIICLIFAGFFWFCFVWQ